MNHRYSRNAQNVEKTREVRYNAETDMIELVTTYSDTGKVVVRPMIPPKKNRERVAWAVGWGSFKQPHEYAEIVNRQDMAQRPCGIFWFAHSTNGKKDEKIWTCRFREPHLEECIHTIEICQKNPVFFNYDRKLIPMRMDWMISQMKKELDQRGDIKQNGK